MRILKIVYLLPILLSAYFAPGQTNSTGSTPSASKAVITGVWRGEMKNLPVVALVVSDEGNALSGAALFYMWKRETVNEPFKATPGIPEPMLNINFDGKTLYFQISHRRSHPPSTLSDPPSRFHLTLTGPEKAELVNDSEHQGPPLEMIHSEY
ncbi:MAG TPA: hypothetical protein VGE85_15575 [Terracidiphilus sp.]|jgi:hypothetical protein